MKMDVPPVLKPGLLVDQLASSTDRLLGSIGALDAAGVGEPSLLPGWRRGHLLTHVARNADGLRSLLLAARSGAELRFYANTEARAADIEAGAGRPGGVVLADVRESSRRFAVEATAMPSDAWGNEVFFDSGQPDPPATAAAGVVASRLQEIEIHHWDLGLAYGPADTPGDVAELLIGRQLSRLAGAGTAIQARCGDIEWVNGSAGLSVQGSRADLLAWLSGRGDGSALAGNSVGRLPPF